MPRRPPAAAVEPADEPDVVPQPTLRRRTPLPNGRAVVGGLLVTASALGVATAHLAADPDERRPYVVARAPIAPGTVVEASQLTTAALELSGSVRERAFDDPTAVEGAVALGPLAAGELVQAGDLLIGATDLEGPRPELSVALERDRAVDGRLVPGDVVDLLATYGSGDRGTTRRVAHQATVQATSDGADGGFAGSALVTVTLALHHDDELLAATHAAREGALTLVRSTGTEGTSGRTYRPEDGLDQDGVAEGAGPEPAR